MWEEPNTEKMVLEIFSYYKLLMEEMPNIVIFHVADLSNAFLILGSVALS
jgi:hypothetical protein